jgi:DNA topoisomerase III
MSAKGLGTPATRATVIEELLLDQYIAREGRDLIATAKGISLITLVKGIGIEQLSSPELTGEWEYQLKLMEQGQLHRDVFMDRIRKLTMEIVDRAKNFESDTVEGDYVTLEVKCPNCGAAQLKEDYRTFHCPSCGYRLFKNVASRALSPGEVTTLIRERQVGPLEGFRSKRGQQFTATLKLNDENKTEFVFESNGAAEIQEIDPATHQKVGICQVCKTGDVYDLGGAYVCENVAKQSCTFKFNKTILKKEILPEQIQKMLETGKSDLIKGFVSKKKGGKTFDAMLTLSEGKIGWEFAKREPKKRGELNKPR